MEPLLFILGLFVFTTAIIIPWIALAKASGARRIADDLHARLDRLERGRRDAQASAVPRADATFAQPLREAKAAPPETPPLPPVASATATAEVPAREHKTLPVPICDEPAPATPTGEPPFNWEQFMGAKLLNWAGGFTLFLGLAFALKYSLDNNLIPPAIRAAVGFVTGIGLILGGLSLNRERYTVTTHTLCATGVVTLYAVTYACRALWHFEHFETTTAFAIMGLVTAAAFTLAVRLEARVVAVLGIAGGFLTPVLISTGNDNIIGLFGYIALLNTGLLAVAIRRRWHFLAGLGATGTVLLSLAWMDRFYDAGHYALLPTAYLPEVAVLLQQALYAVACRHVARRDGDAGDTLGRSALATAVLSGAFGARFLFDHSHGGDVTAVANTPAVGFGYLFVIEAGLILLGTRARELAWAGPAAGGAIAAMLGLWMGDKLTHDNLAVMLALITVFAVLHAALPAVLRRLGKLGATPAWTHLAAPVALTLALIPVFRFDNIPQLVWPALFILDLLAIVIAAMTLVVWPVVVALLGTLIGVGTGLLDITATATGLNGMLLILAGFAIAFTVAGIALGRRLTAAAGLGETSEGKTAAMLPALAAALPFLLLILVVVKLPLADPTAPFAVGLLLSLVLLGLTDKCGVHAAAPVGLAGVTLLQLAWRDTSFGPANAPAALAWHLGFAAAYLMYPFIRHRRFAGETTPWIAAALALPAHFLPVYNTVTTAWPTNHPGYIPALFALPAAAGLALILRRTPADSPARLTQSALFGGVTLLFITLIFPIEFENQWLTLAWALEGAALIRLHRRIPHGGLVAVGLALLAAAFVRLTLNEAVLGYHPRADWPIFNTYLYTYGVAAAAMAIAAKGLPPKYERAGDVPVRGLLHAAVAILAFILLNLEIADYFTAPGAATTAMSFHGDFTRDMTYSIAWGLFATGLLLVGIAKNLRAARYAAIGLLLVTLGKLFLHDLTQLDKLHRIGAFIGVAAIMLIVSALYQKFRAGERA